MKKIIILFAILFSVSTFGQEGDTSIKPNFTPPSPEAFAMTKYGDIPTNEFSGMINFSTPIHTFVAGKLQLPISLNYSGAGLKVDDVPTKTGMGWILNAGGIITRVIKDLPDEDTNLRIFKTPQEFADLNTEDGTPGATLLSSYVCPSNSFDTEADIFSYNFNGYSGSFYLDQNYERVLIKEESELKIEIVGTDDDKAKNLKENKTFVVTTPDGVKYFFGGDNAVENTISLHDDSFSGISSYHLYKIIHPVNGEINIEYITQLQNVTVLGKNERITFLSDDNYPDSPFEIQTTNGPVFFTCKPPNYQSDWHISAQTLRVNNVRFISKIYSPNTNESVNFIYQEINDFKILDKIEIKTTINNIKSLLKDVQFDYFNLQDFAEAATSKQRFFLKSLIINNQIITNRNAPNKKEIWGFEYDEYSDLPDRGSFAQDEGGFYNGKPNTTLLSSQTIYIPNNIIDPYYEYPGADRSSDFEYAKKGSLSKITYPTGGFTKFDYECIPYKKRIYRYHQLDIKTGFDPYDPDNGEGQTASTGEIPTCTLPGYDQGNDEVVNFPPIIEDQKVEFYLYSKKSDMHAQGGLFNVKVTNLTDTIIVYDEYIHYNIGEYNSNGYPLGTKFTLDFYKDKEYKIELTDIDPPVVDLACRARLSFSVYEYEYKDAAGIRVKRQIDYAKENEISNYKRYYYMPLDYIFLPIHLQPISTNNRYTKTRSSMIYKVGCHPQPFVPYWSKYVTIFSDPVSNTFEIYKNSNRCVVTSLGGENFEKGGIERFYHFEDDLDFGTQELQQMQLVGSVNENFSNQIALNDFIGKTSNITTLNGDLEKEYYFIKKNTAFNKLKTVDYNYNKQTVDGFTNFVGKKFYEPFAYPEYDENGQPIDIHPGTTTSNYYLKIYKTLLFRNILNSKKETAYFEDTPMPTVIINTVDGLPIEINEPDETNTKKITTTQTFEYGTLRGLPTKITTKTSDNNKDNITQNIYANQANTFTDLTQAQLLAYGNLKAQNNIVSPIQVEQLQNTELLSKQRTLYKQGYYNPNQILPDIIQTTKGTQNLEDRVIFDEYDPKGNPSIVSYKNGSKTKYFYNDNNQVIVKIENYTGSFNFFGNPVGNTLPCDFINQYPNSFVTIYNYDPIINQVISIISPNCKYTYYEYDDFHRLLRIKDDEGNILQEYDNNYKP